MRITAGCIFVLSMLALAATAPTAVAEEFVASKTGKLTGKALNTQEFKTGNGSAVTCTKATPTGTIAKEEETEQLVSVSYSSCTVSGLGSASVSLADYTFFVPLGVSILNGAGKNIIIKGTALGVECEVEVANGQTLGKGLAKSGKMEIEYVNKAVGGKEVIEEKNEIEKIESKVIKSNSSTLCGTVGSVSTTGTYVGNHEIELEGGSIAVEAGDSVTLTGNPSFNFTKTGETIGIIIENKSPARNITPTNQEMTAPGFKESDPNNCILKVIPADKACEVKVTAIMAKSTANYKVEGLEAGGWTREATLTVP